MSEELNEKKHGWCKICGQSVDLSSDEQSEAANWIEVHQTPCLDVFMVALSDAEGKHLERAEALEELLEGAVNRCMCHRELTLPYFHWTIELFFYLWRRPEILKELESKFKEKRKERTDN